MQLRSVVDGLVNHTGGAISRDRLTALVDELYDEMAAKAKVDTFLPVLVSKAALSRLEGGLDDATQALHEAPEVLIICQANAGRSQTAAALLRNYAPGDLYVVAAGVEPADQVLPTVRDALISRGLRLIEQPQPYTPQMLSDAAHVIVIGNVTAQFAPGTGQDLHIWDDIPPIENVPDADVPAVLRQIDDWVRDLVATWHPEIDLGEPVMAQLADPA